MSDPFSRAWDSAGDQWNAWFRSGGGGGGSQEFGGLSPEDEAFKKMLYDSLENYLTMKLTLVTGMQIDLLKNLPFSNRRRKVTQCLTLPLRI